MQPIDYTFQAPDPGQAFMQSLIAAQKQRAAQEAAQAKAAEKAEQDRALAELAANPNAGARDYARITARFPGLAEPLKKSFDMLAPEIKQTRINLGYQAVGAVENGKPEVAVSILNRQAEAARGAGDENAAKAYETWGKLIEADPKAASRTVALMLSGVDEKFAENFGKIRTEFRTQDMASDVARRTAAEASKAEGEAIITGVKANAYPDVQRIEIQGQLIDQETKREMTRLKSIEVALGRETNQLKREELQQKLDQGRADLETKRAERKAEADGALLRIQDNLTTLQEIKDLGGVSWMTTANRNLPFTDSKAIGDKIEQLKGQLTFENLKAMAGATNISNADMVAVQKAVSSLSLLQAPEQTRKELAKIEAVFKRAEAKTREKFGFPQGYNAAATSSDPRVHRLMRDAGLSEEDAIEFLKQRK